MKYRRLGRTGIEVSEIGFGAWGIGKRMWVGAEDDVSMRALHQAADAGINFFDTALVYGNGHSERLIGRLLRERPEKIYVASKVPPRNLRWPASGSAEEAFPAHHIVSSTETSLRNLGVDTLDLMQLHVWSPDWLDRPEWFGALCKLQEQGKIAAFGISVNDHSPESALELVKSGKISTVQVIYNIFDQSPEDELFPLCLEKDVGVIVRVPLDEGGLTGGITPDVKFPQKDWRNVYFREDRKAQVHERVTAMQPLLLESGAATLPELALRFCLHHPAVSSVIPGMRKVEHVKLNAACSDKPPLSARLTKDLREHRWERNFYP